MKNTLLTIGALAFCVVLVTLGEILCRQLVDLPLQGTDRNLFVAAAFGPSEGNAPNAEAIAYDKWVYTDPYGFRVPESLRGKEISCRNGILILGDSVAFGLGVDEPETFAGRLRESLPSVCIHNSSVIGYCTTDYKNVVENLPPLKSDIKAVIMVFCLNDLISRSAIEIDQELGTPAGKAGSGEDIFGRMKRIHIIRDLNLFLRARSKLYLTIRNAFFDSQKSNWLAVRRLYEDENEASLVAMLKPIRDIAGVVGRQDIPFRVIIAPYEFQLRNQTPESRLPQEKLARFFRKEGVDFVDPIPEFLRVQRPSKDFFLPRDPMHLSALGHEVMFQVIMNWAPLKMMND